MKKILIILLLFNLNFEDVASIEADIFVQSTVNRASQILSKNISNKKVKATEKGKSLDKIKNLYKKTFKKNSLEKYKISPEIFQNFFKV